MSWFVRCKPARCKSEKEANGSLKRAEMCVTRAKPLVSHRDVAAERRDASLFVKEGKRRFGPNSGKSVRLLSLKCRWGHRVLVSPGIAGGFGSAAALGAIWARSGVSKKL